MNGAYAGRYKLQVVSLDGCIKYESDWFDNLITNAGLDAYGGIRSNTFRAYIGTGTTVAETDTSMPAVATTTSVTRAVSYQEVSAPYWIKERFIFTFAVGAYVGTISDVGVGWGTGVASFTPLYSHALLPSPITLGAIDQVVLTYDHYYCVSDYTTCEFELNGILTTSISKPYQGGAAAVSLANPGLTYDFSENIYVGTSFYTNFVIADINNWDGAYKTITNDYETDASTTTLTTYSAGSFKRGYTKTYNAELGNRLNISGFFIPVYVFGSATACGFAGSFSPAWSKTDLQRLILSGEVTWARTTVPE